MFSSPKRGHINEKSEFVRSYRRSRQNKKKTQHKSRVPHTFTGVCSKTKLRLRIKSKRTIEIWLILPVVICLFQGLSHACLRITALQESAHGSLHQTQSAAKMLRFPQNWIPWRNAKLIHEYTRAFSIHAASFRRRRSESPRE